MKQPKRAWIQVLGEGEESPELLEVYKQFDIPPDDVENILAVHSLSAASLRGHMDLYRTLMYGPSPLRRSEREMVAVTVSTLNECHY